MGILNLYFFSKILAANTLNWVLNSVEDEKFYAAGPMGIKISW